MITNTPVHLSKWKEEQKGSRNLAALISNQEVSLGSWKMRKSRDDQNQQRD